jgi:hypothetical protein
MRTARCRTYLSSCSLSIPYSIPDLPCICYATFVHRLFCPFRSRRCCACVSTIVQIDVQIGGRRAGYDGTPNESTSDVLVRTRQVLSVTETQYDEETIIFVAPDSSVLSILEAALLGIDLRDHWSLSFRSAPSEDNIHDFQPPMLGYRIFEGPMPSGSLVQSKSGLRRVCCTSTCSVSGTQMGCKQQFQIDTRAACVQACRDEDSTA